MTLDFEHWMLNQLPKLPDDIWEYQGRLVYCCKSCGSIVDLLCDPSEFKAEGAYCGSYPGCVL
jgi:hypothetical protein